MSPKKPSAMNRRKRQVAQMMIRGMDWALENLPPGVRFVLGLVLMAGGVLGFLPILGFWMLPLGVAFVAMDIPPARHRLRRWLERYAAPQPD